MTIRPDEIDAARLPHARVGGYNVAATDELLKQVAWDYRQIAHENAELAEQNQALLARILELEQRVEAVEAERDRLQSRHGLAAATLAAAQRAARDAREDARRECEQMLKAARRRAAEIDQTMEKALAARSGEVQALEEAQQRLLGELRRVFSAALDSVDQAGSAALGDLADELGEAVGRVRQKRLSAVPTPGTATTALPVGGEAAADA